MCTICGCTNFLALTRMPLSQLPRSIQRRVHEKHHLAGREAGGWVIVVCLNCHAALSDAQYDWDDHLRHPRTKNQHRAAYLRGLADMFRQESTARTTLAGELETIADELASQDALTDEGGNE